MAGCMFENQPTCIKQAILGNDATVLKTYLKHGENPLLTDRKSNTYLHYVCTMYRPEIFHILVSCGINLNAQNRHGNTALHVTALHNECGHVGDLLAAGIDPSIKNKDGKTAIEIKTKNLFWKNIYLKYQPGIFEAVAAHDVDKVLHLLHCWSRVDTKRDGQTLRQFAAAHKFHDLVYHIDYHAATLGAIYAVLEKDAEKTWKFLSLPKCNVNFLNYAADNSHILQYAIKHGEPRIISMMCKANVDVNIRVRAPLFFAVFDSKNSEEIIWPVLKCRADFKFRDEKGRNAGIYALDKSKGKISTEVVVFMLKNGLDISQRDCAGVTFRDVALLYRRVDIIKLVDKALVKTIRSSDIPELERLAIMGYDSLFIHFNHRNTYIYASGNESPKALEFTKWLPQFYSEVKTFHHGVQMWPVDKVEIFLNSSDWPDLLIKARDKGGRSALHLCILHFRVDVFKLLISRPNIDVNMSDNMGRTLFHYACATEELDERRVFCSLLETDKALNKDAEDFIGRKPYNYVPQPKKAADWIDKERRACYGMTKQLLCADKYEELCHLMKCKRKTLKHFENAICKFQYPIAQFNKILKPVMSNYRDLIFLAMEMGKEPIAVRLIQLGADWNLQEICEVKKRCDSNEAEMSQLVMMSAEERAMQLQMTDVLKAIKKRKCFLEKSGNMTEKVASRKEVLVRKKSELSDNISSDVEFVVESDVEEEDVDSNVVLDDNFWEEENN